MDEQTRVNTLNSSAHAIASGVFTRPAVYVHVWCSSSNPFDEMKDSGPEC